MRDLCAHLFKDFQFGLSLIKKNTGKGFVLAARPRSRRRINSSVSWCCNPTVRAAIARQNEARAARETSGLARSQPGWPLRCKSAGCSPVLLAALGKAIGLSPNEAVGFWNFLFLILLSFSVAWTMLQVTGMARQAGLFALLDLGIARRRLGAACGPCFLPAVAGHPRCDRCDSSRAWSECDPASRQRTATARAFAGRLAQTGIDRLTKSEPLNLFGAECTRSQLCLL